MIHESFPIIEDFFASLANQPPVVLGELDAGGVGVLVNEHARLGTEGRVASRALEGFVFMVLSAPEEVELGNVDAELLGIFLAVVNQQLGPVDNVLGDPIVDLAVELEPHHVLGVTFGGAVDFCEPVNCGIDAPARIYVADNLKERSKNYQIKELKETRGKKSDQLLLNKHCEVLVSCSDERFKKNQEFLNHS